MSEFIKIQAEETSPVEFLQLYAGHMTQKNQVFKQKTTMSDIKVDMKLSGKPIITSDQTVKYIDIQHVNQAKQQMLDKNKNNIEKMHMA
mmetsp:Transcript_22832/g.22081  ORF Transcript_22832/g.22081 Transcript_22832/m.22081 type:complete len:89 (+) Transcript_22832:556-822(+)